jgi:hypothetical protein
VASVLRNANGLGLIAVNAITRGLQDVRLLGFVAHLQREYGDCLPPPMPPPS